MFLAATIHKFVFVVLPPLSKLSIRNIFNLEIVFCRIIAVLMPKPIRKITLKMDFSVPCCDIQHIFFFMAIQGNTQLSKLSIRNKLNLEMVFCRISVMITSKPIRKITHSAYKIFKTIFVCSNVTKAVIKTFHFK